jgi:release factor glutamine methyltransferase
VTLLDAIQRSTEFLARKGVESPRLQAELLLAHVLKRPRMRLYLDFEHPLEGPALEGFRDFIRRRGQREPLQHIVGTTSFCGFELSVTGAALVPRPETELLAEQGWLFLGRCGAPSGEPATALDIGTGTGCLAITLVAKVPTAQVYALDVSPAALNLARGNASRCGLEGRLGFIQSDGFAALTPECWFDLIISNPPYIPSGEIATLEPEVREHDPRLALDGGADGLDFYRRLAREAGAYLKPTGKMMLEFGDGQTEALREMFLRENWVVEQVLDDYNRCPRILIVCRGEPRA